MHALATEVHAPTTGALALPIGVIAPTTEALALPIGAFALAIGVIALATEALAPTSRVIAPPGVGRSKDGDPDLQTARPDFIALTIQPVAR